MAGCCDKAAGHRVSYIDRPVVPRIYTRCPACHNDTLTINRGHLLCTWITCPDPTLIDRIGEPDYQPNEKAEGLR